jgi:hypothetical protein
MILGVQIIGLIFGLLMAYFIFLHYRRHEFSMIEFLFWEAVWIVYIIFVVFPGITSGIVYKLGILRAMDLFTILGFMFVLFFSFKNYFTIKKIKEKIDKDVITDALSQLDKK